MILGDGQPAVSFYDHLETLEADSQIERTPDGFDFHVVSSDRLSHPYGVSGLVVYGRDEIELELLMGSDIDSKVRPQIAALVIEMCRLRGEGFPSAFALCEAGQHILPTLEPALRQQTGSVIHENLKGFRRWVGSMDAQKRYQEVSRMERLQLKHSLGWAALERGLSERGQENVDALIEQGLNVPSIADNEVLVSQGKNKLQGVGVTVFSAVEKGSNHKCKSCSGEIHQGTTRITASYDKKLGRFDHHHYHPACYAEGDMLQLDLKSARIIKSEW